MRWKPRENKADLTAIIMMMKRNFIQAARIHFESKTHFDMIVELFHRIQLEYLIVCILFELSVLTVYFSLFTEEFVIIGLFFWRTVRRIHSFSAFDAK